MCILVVFKICAKQSWLGYLLLLCFVTFSMGGAIAVNVATRQKLTALAALVVIDVVEGLMQLLFQWYFTGDEITSF